MIRTTYANSLWLLDDVINSAYDNSDWIDAVFFGVTPDLNDLFISEQLDSYAGDTGLRVEYQCMDSGNWYTGTIQSWHNNPYDFNDDSDNFAYIIRDGEVAGDYGHIATITVLEKELGYEATNWHEPVSFVLPPLEQGSRDSTGKRDSREDLSIVLDPACIVIAS